jgi:hypothetical protein
LQARADVDELYANSKWVFGRISGLPLFISLKNGSSYKSFDRTPLENRARAREKPYYQTGPNTSMLVHIIGGFIVYL